MASALFPLAAGGCTGIAGRPIAPNSEYAFNFLKGLTILHV
jgi:hypothetical protein